MVIKITFVSELTRSSRSRELVNLSAMLMDLALPQVVLLEWLGTEIEVRQGQANPQWLLHPRTIVLDVAALRSFTYRPKAQPSLNQSRAQAALTKQVIEMLDLEFRCTSRRGWKNAARADIRDVKLLTEPSPDATCAEESTSSRGGPDSLIHRVLWKVNSMLPAIFSSPERRLLGEILLERDRLRVSRQTQAAIDRSMSRAFPRTYRLALDFETLLERRAADIAVRRHPELAAQATEAMRAIRRELQITWPQEIGLPGDDAQLTRHGPSGRSSRRGRH